MGGIFANGIWNAFACGSSTTGAMDKWILQADLAHQVGLNLTFHAVLIVVESGDQGG